MKPEPITVNTDLYVIRGFNSEDNVVYFDIDRTTGYPSSFLFPRTFFFNLRKASTRLDDASNHCGIRNPKVFKIVLVEEDISALEYEELDEFVEGLTPEQLDYLKGKL
jgi:hypothetical protein